MSENAREKGHPPIHKKKEAAGDSGSLLLFDIYF
jgi:hypothetical protein